MGDAAPDRDLRLAIVADNASARFGGEAILPLHYFRRLRARGVAVWLVVHERTRGELEELLGEDIRWVRFVPDQWIHHVAFRLAQRLPARMVTATITPISQGATGRAQRRLLQRLIVEEGIQLVHQPTPVSPKLASALYGLGVPVIIGPMNGGMSYPPAFQHLDTWRTRALVRAGRRLGPLANRVTPGKREAALLLVANQRTREALSVDHPRVLEVPENGVDMSLWEPVPEAHYDRPPGALRMVFLGRLVRLKGVDFLLRAMKDLDPSLDVTLDIIGDGEDRGRLESLAVALGLEDRVTFRGFVPQAEAARELGTYDCLVLPSLHECGGAVVLEAMATGLPVVATDWGGPADYVRHGTTGFLVPPASEAAFVDGLGEALARLARDPGLRERFGRAGRARVAEEFDWERKVDRMLELYADEIARASKPA